MTQLVLIKTRHRAGEREEKTKAQRVCVRACVCLMATSLFTCTNNADLFLEIFYVPKCLKICISACS